MAEGQDCCDDLWRAPFAFRSRVSSSTQTWLPPEPPSQPGWRSDAEMEQLEDLAEYQVGLQRSEVPTPCFYEDVFCGCQSVVAVVRPVTLTGALLPSSWPQSDVVKQSYLGKMKRNHRRYFVLRTGSHSGPSRIEWYKSQEKFVAMEKSGGKAAHQQGVIYTRCCLSVNRTATPRKGHTVALYAKDQTMVLVVKDQQEQEDWYLAIKKLMEEERKDEERGKGCDEDDGYYTLPTGAFYKKVWLVSVKPRGLAHSKFLSGESRLYLTARSLILIRTDYYTEVPSMTIPLLSVRRFGHLDGSFFLELGRSAPDGPGEIWMEARDQGIAQQIHEVVRDTVRALRALPTFTWSPASKRSRLAHKEKLVNVRSPCPPPVQLCRDTDIQMSPTPASTGPCTPDRIQPESPLSPQAHGSPERSWQSFSCSESGSYVEMKMERGYMMMSPQGNHGSPAQPPDDYMAMASPQKCHYPAHSSSSSPLQTSFSGSTSAHHSPVHMTHLQSSEPPSPQQSPMSISISRRQHPAETTVPPSPVLHVPPPFATTRPATYNRSVQTSPKSNPGESQTDVDQPAVRRSRLSFLLSCLKAEEKP